MNKHDFLQTARDYVNNKHYSVIPVAKNKIPLINWKPYQERFATDEELVQWAELPDVQLGIVCGALSNLTVVDVEKGGNTSCFSQTGTIVETGGGGAHFYFLYESRLRNKARVMDLVDVRSEGGYVVAPGSESNKGFYKIAQEALLAPVPVSFVEKAENSSRIAGFDAISAMLDANQNPGGNDFGYPGHEIGNRNEEMTRFIGSVLAKVHPANWNTEAWKVIVLANLKNRPPLPERELRASFESIKQIEVRNNPSKWNKTSSAVDIDKLKTYEEEDKVVLAETKKKELEEKRKNVPRFIAECGIPSLDACLEGFRIGQLIVLSGPPKAGKCLGKGTNILMFNGEIKKVENIKIGDLIMGPDSLPRKVLSLARGEEMMYKICQRGESYIVNESHILSLKRNNGSLWRTDNFKKEKRPRRRKKGEICNISIKDFLAKSITFRHHHKGYKVSIDFSFRPINLDPYFLGIWLGDGTSKKSEITTADKEIVAFLNSFALKNGWRIRAYMQKNNASMIYCLAGGKKKECLLARLRNLGVWGDKHIPYEYKINSKAIRLELLAGLIDTDGYKSNRNGYDSYEIIQKSKRLADDITFLARSCGLAVTLTKCKKGIKKINFVGTYYRMRISGNIHEIPVRIERKKVTRISKKDALSCYIKVLPLGPGDYYGFEIDGDGLFLLGDFTVTHNTALCQTFTKKFIKDGTPCLWFSYEIPYEELFEKFPFTNLDFYVPNYLKSGNIDWIEERIVESIQKYGTKIVFIDHLDFLRDPNVLKGINLNLSSYVGGIVQKVKSIAYKHSIIIFLMCHIRKNKWTSKYLPASEEIRDSGQITQLADIVLMIMRKRSKDPHEIYDGNKAYIGVMENRQNGKTTQILLNFVDKEYIQDSCGILEDLPDLEEIERSTSKEWKKSGLFQQTLTNNEETYG